MYYINLLLKVLMESKLKKQNNETKSNRKRIDYISIKPNSQEDDNKYLKKRNMNLIVIVSFITMMLICLVIYLIFYCKRINILICFGVLIISLYLFFKNLRKEYYNSTVSTLYMINTMIRKKIYKEDQEIADRVYYSLNI
jgi:hypothetical protein